ncbi:MAG: pseudaminic acid synthase [Fibrobacterota bacterium]
MRYFSAGNRTVGKDASVFIIAEMSANHLGSYDNAEDIIRAAARAGADAVKLQTYRADTMTIDCDRGDFVIRSGSPWDGRRYYELYESAATPWEWHKSLKDLTEKLGMLFFSTPFDVTAVDFLEELDVPLYKLASFEITDIPLIRRIAQTGKPVIFSSGIAEKDDIRLACETFRGAGTDRLALLKCISSYPAPAAEYNLRTIPAMEQDFDLIPGLSDHSKGSAVPVAAAALGAKIIEKHLCLDRTLGGPDAAFSLEPEEFATMVADVRTAEAALGEPTYELSERQKSNRAFGRSIYVTEDLAAGERLSTETIRVIRPGGGLHPRYREAVLGRPVLRDLRRGEPLHLSDIVGGEEL